MSQGTAVFPHAQLFQVGVFVLRLQLLEHELNDALHGGLDLALLLKHLLVLVKLVLVVARVLHDHLLTLHQQLLQLVVLCLPPILPPAGLLDLLPQTTCPLFILIRPLEQRLLAVMEPSNGGLDMAQTVVLFFDLLRLLDVRVSAPDPLHEPDCGGSEALQEVIVTLEARVDQKVTNVRQYRFILSSQKYIEALQQKQQLHVVLLPHGFCVAVVPVLLTTAKQGLGSLPRVGLHHEHAHG
mmetsp:Transcript_3474/g.6487  ORF Transcript_3474/g.6487 Transcript_3474/m.6487 type:complete len:240 (-) Transcript_3474:12-731(-)